MFANKIHEQAHETLKAGSIEKAILLYTKALSQSKGHPDIISDRAVAYLHQNNKELCYADFEEALELEPKRAYRYTSFAFAMNHFGDIEGAIQKYERAVELDPDDAVAHNNLGLLLENKGYKDAAQAKFDRADRLSKLEDGLLDIVDEIDGETEEIENISSPEEHEENLPPKENEPSVSSEIKKVFTKKETFKEFLRFIKNGFKLKK
jgi:tetratricopeptide (TPR) repeat protein